MKISVERPNDRVGCLYMVPLHATFELGQTRVLTVQEPIKPHMQLSGASLLIDDDIATYFRVMRIRSQKLDLLHAPRYCYEPASDGIPALAFSHRREHPPLATPIDLATFELVVKMVRGPAAEDFNAMLEGFGAAEPEQSREDFEMLRKLTTVDEHGNIHTRVP